MLTSGKGSPVTRVLLRTGFIFKASFFLFAMDELKSERNRRMIKKQLKNLLSVAKCQTVSVKLVIIMFALPILLVYIP